VHSSVASESKAVAGLRSSAAQNNRSLGLSSASPAVSGRMRLSRTRRCISRSAAPASRYRAAAAVPSTHPVAPPAAPAFADASSRQSASSASITERAISRSNILISRSR
jgi:hypothetical protein